MILAPALRLAAFALPALPALFILPALPAGAQSATFCGSHPTQMEINDCAGRAFAAADARLNALWAPVMAAHKGTAAGSALREAQRAWIAFRDLACNAESLQYEGGSIMGLIYTSCRERETRARIVGLQQFLN